MRMGVSTRVSLALLMLREGEINRTPPKQKEIIHVAVTSEYSSLHFSDRKKLCALSVVLLEVPL